MERSRTDDAPGAGAAEVVLPEQAAAYNGVVFWPVASLVVLADLVTKAIAAYALAPRGFAHEVIGETVRLTLVYNPGAAFGMHLGPYSRWIFLALTVGVLAVLWRLFKATPAGDNRRTLSLALLCGGAVGNALDRVRSADGVVDFIDLGVGAMRWPTFNLADVAVTGGALLLLRALWHDESERTDSPSVVATGTPETP